MSDSKENAGFFRKVARFVANPATDWSTLSSRQDSPESELAKAELRAMIDRKRRNDFVRKRELDMLRRIRRQGLTPDQLAALGGATSGLDAPSSGTGTPSRLDDVGVKAKIDAIEQQMVGESLARSRTPPPASPKPLAPASVAPHFPPTELPVTAPPAARPAAAAVAVPPMAPPAAAPAAAIAAPPPAAAAPLPTPPAPSAVPVRAAGLRFDDDASSIEVNEIVHDAELDEAVIAFANGDNDICEQSLVRLTSAQGARAEHAETWLALFDFYRATGQQARFDALAGDYAEQFGLSAPQWLTASRAATLVAADVSHDAAPTPSVCWAATLTLEPEAVAALGQRTATLPLPWVMDWEGLQRIEPQAADELRSLFRQWAAQKIDLVWLSGAHLLDVLKELTPTGSRDVDPAFWMLRLEALRLAHRPDVFDETAIDYCITYEISPPSWEAPLCTVRMGDSTLSKPALLTTDAPLTEVPASTSFMDTNLGETGQTAQFELAGELVGDIAPLLQEMAQTLGTASLVQIQCARLLRLDFMAAGDLLNWVLARRGENRSVVFQDTHRLVALFFHAMGINEHARIKLRLV